MASIGDCSGLPIRLLDFAKLLPEVERLLG
jgi:hypothetical protein